jgi:hypothetical protein
MVALEGEMALGLRAGTPPADQLVGSASAAAETSAVASVVLGGCTAAEPGATTAASGVGFPRCHLPLLAGG